MDRLAAAFALVATLAVASCGAAPDDVEATTSALHDANGMWIGGPNHLTGTYSCGGQTWTMKGDFDQSFYSGAGGLYLSRLQPWFGFDASRPELTVSSCVNAQEGNQFFMSRSGASVLYNISPKTCLLYSHVVGASAWTAVASATIYPADFQYVKPGPTSIQDRFQVVVTPDTGIGNPGVCSSMVTTFYFSAP